MQDILTQYRIGTEPYYRPIDREIELFAAAYSRRLPMILKGPTGAAKRASSNTWRRD